MMGLFTELIFFLAVGESSADDRAPGAVTACDISLISVDATVTSPMTIYIFSFVIEAETFRFSFTVSFRSGSSLFFCSLYE